MRKCPECGHERLSKKGNNPVNNIIITASNGAKIICPITIGSTILGSIKIIQESKADNRIISEVETLLEQIATISGHVDETDARDLADESKSLSLELASDKPRKRHLDASLDGIVEAAKKVGDAALPILETAAKIGELFA